MSRQAVRVVAHRGMGQGFVQKDAPPENTLPAFIEGWKVGRACELDVHLTKDGQVIVIHDDTTDRTTNASWTVSDHIAAELRSLDAGRWKAQKWAGTRLPLLEEVLDLMPDGRELFVDLKAGPQVVLPTAELVRQSCKGSRVVLISFEIDTFVAAKQELPEIDCRLIVAFEADYCNDRWNLLFDEGPGFRTVATTSTIEELIALVKQYELNDIDSNLTVPVIRRPNDGNLRSVVWTVDEPSIALDMIRLGVDTITTDRPGPIREALIAAGYAVR